MSRPCLLPECRRPVSDGSRMVGCSLHDPRIRYFTRQRLETAGTGGEYDAAYLQACVEMRQPLGLEEVTDLAAARILDAAPDYQHDDGEPPYDPMDPADYWPEEGFIR